MKLIIDIPEEVKHKVYAYGLSLSPSDKEQLIHAIMNGIPLPKGHGRLIDADAFAIRGEYFEKLYGNDFYWEFKKRLDKQPTIIEADKEGEE